MKHWIVWTVAGIALLSLIAWRARTKSEANQSLTQSAGRRGGSLVEVETASRKTMFETIDSVGAIEAQARVLISPKVAGRIEFIEVREGDQVAAGQILARIDPSEIEAQVLQQRANVAEARSRLVQAQLNQGPTNAGIEGQLTQQNAGLTTAQADLKQVEGAYAAQLISSESDVSSARSRVKSAEAQVDVAEAQLKRAETNRDNARARVDRLATLLEKGYVSQQDYDNAVTALAAQEADVRVAKSQLSAAKLAVDSANSQLKITEQQREITKQKGQADIVAARAKVTQAKEGVKVATANRAQTPAYKQNLAALTSSVDAALAQLKQAESRLSETALRSPVSGTVTARNADIGTLATPSQPVLEVQALETIYVTASFPVERSASVRPGQAAELRIEAITGGAIPCVIEKVNFAADPATRQFSVLIKLPNPNLTIRPGMYATVHIKIREIKGALTIPREALKTGSEGSTVVVVGEDKKASVRNVKVGMVDGSSAQILEGLKEGDRVVTLSYAPIKDGQELTLAEKGGGAAKGGERKP